MATRCCKWLILTSSLQQLSAADLRIDSISPTSVLAGAPGFILDVFGGSFCPSNPFLEASTITWNGMLLNTLFVDTGHLRGLVDASRLTQPGKALIAVHNVHCDPPNSVSSGYPFIIAAPLQITSMSPLPGGVVESSYVAQLTAQGGIPPYRWQLDAGSDPLQSGLQIDNTG